VLALPSPSIIRRVHVLPDLLATMTSVPPQ
jgi:hypothetical protein